MDHMKEKNDPLFFRVKSAVAESAHDELRVEKHILKFSFCFALFFAVLGLVWGVLIRSQMLIFDGVYSFLSVLMTSISVYVAGIVRAKDDARFPFGRSQVEPLIIMLKSLVILVVCISALSKAMISLSSGGRGINALSAMAYSFLGVLVCTACWLYIVRMRRKVLTSGLVRAESMQWLADTLLSVAIFLGFLAAYVIGRTEHSRYAAYVDPLMVVVAALFFSAVPLISLIGGIRDILHMAPDDDVYRASRVALQEVASMRGFDGFVLRIAKSGRKLVYEIGFVSDDPDDIRSMGELDEIREEVEGRLKALYDNPMWLDISFMRDKKWG